MRRIPDRRVVLSAAPSRALAFSAFVCGMALTTTPANAQTSSEAAAAQQNPPCRIFATDVPDGRGKELFASCGGRGLMLGQSTGYQVIANEALKATLIDTRAGSDRRVLLITIQDDGSPLVEDLSVDLAVAAGRGPMVGLAGLDVDFTGFANDGSVGVRPAPDSASKDKSGAINVGQQISAERARRQGAALHD